MVPFLKLLVPRVPYLEMGDCNRFRPKTGGSSVFSLRNWWLRCSFQIKTGGSNDFSLRN